MKLSKKRQKQVWRCQGCGHEFYTPIEKKQSLLRRIFGRREKIECKVCAEVKAIRVRVVNFKQGLTRIKDDD